MKMKWDTGVVGAVVVAEVGGEGVGVEVGVGCVMGGSGFLLSELERSSGGGIWAGSVDDEGLWER